MELTMVNFEGKHIIVKETKSHKDIADRVFYCKHGFGCDPKASGTKIYGQFMIDPKDVYIRRESVERLATDDEIKQARDKLWTLVKDEICTCGHLKSKHAGLNGHGACTKTCTCRQFTWAKWVLKS
jgi:hypothetical protein